MEENSVVVSLSLGSNQGNKELNLRSAIELIGIKLGQVLSTSDIYKSEPWGFESENDFLNCCCLVQTNFELIEFMDRTQEIEIALGKKERKEEKYTDRFIDIDVIFFDDLVIKSEKITIPHKNFRMRDFVLLPLNQISNQIDPETFITVNQFTK